MRKLTEQIEHTLRDVPETRNSDIALMVAIWRRYFPKVIKYSIGREYVMLEDIPKLPREDNIKRIRAYFQNGENMYCATHL